MNMILTAQDELRWFRIVPTVVYFITVGRAQRNVHDPGFQ
jgi:hypothetical protein